MSPRLFDHRQLDMFPPVSDWQPPAVLRMIAGASVVAIDIETRDDGINADIGPGWVNRNGHICGFSVAVPHNDPIYVPLRHPATDNFLISEATNWLQNIIVASRTCVFHNIEYDRAWLEVDLGIVFPSHVIYNDTHAMAVMLDENRSNYSLDSCCEWQDLPKKDETLLREAAQAFSMHPKADLWRMPAKYVGPYAEQDAQSTLMLYNKLLPQLVEQDLMKAYRLEMDLVPLTIEMRKRGIRIDEDRCERVKELLYVKRNSALYNINLSLDIRRPVTIEDCNSPGWLEQAFTSQGIDFPRTPKTRQGQFKADWMSTIQHPLPQSIVAARKYHDAAHKFIETYIQGYAVNGRIHAEVHRLRSDDGGTRSHRFSYSNPPLQQIPGRDPELGPLIRSLFLPEEGTHWGSFDIKQQEPRFTVHYASVHNAVGAKKAVNYYTSHPNPDYHQMVAEITGLPRDKAKIINLSLAYGMGEEEMAKRLQCTAVKARGMIAQYNKNLPFVQQLTRICSYEASTKGYITLIDGARCRFNMWEPDVGARVPPATSLREARARWPNLKLKRAMTHKAFNRLIQGSSARQVKMIMRECYRANIIPMLQMHDELDVSVVSDHDVKQVSDIMCNTLVLNVPTAIDIALGDNWGEAK